MFGLALLSAPFALIAFRSGRAWSVALPLVWWAALGALQSLGILHAFSGDAVPALMVGGFVAAAAGYALARRRGAVTD